MMLEPAQSTDRLTIDGFLVRFAFALLVVRRHVQPHALLLLRLGGAHRVAVAAR